MPVPVPVPDALAARIQTHVQSGEYGSLASAVEDLLRRGLASLELAPVPPPPLPPPNRDPGDDRPIDVNPGRDVNWAWGGGGGGTPRRGSPADEA